MSAVRLGLVPVLPVSPIGRTALQTVGLPSAALRLEGPREVRRAHRLAWVVSLVAIR